MRSWTFKGKIYCEDCADDIREQLSQEGAIPRGLPQDELVKWDGYDSKYLKGPNPGGGEKCSGCGDVLPTQPGDTSPYFGSKTETCQQMLAHITTRDEKGRHFTELFHESYLRELEGAGLIRIDRPVHQPTGIPYSQEYWTVEVTDEGQALVDIWAAGDMAD